MRWTTIYLASAMVGSVAASAPACAQMGVPTATADPGRPGSGSYEQGYGYGQGYPFYYAYGSGYGHPYDYASPSGLEGEVASPLATGQDR